MFDSTLCFFSISRTPEEAKMTNFNKNDTATFITTFAPLSTFRISSFNPSINKLTNRNVQSISNLKRRSNHITSCAEKTDPDSTTEQLGESLVGAAMKGDETAVKNLLSSTPKPNPSYASEKSPSKMTALMWACAEGHVSITESLIEAGADLNATNTEGATALLLALENLPNDNPRPAPPAGYPGAAPTLLFQKKTRDDYYGDTPAQKAVEPKISGHVLIISLLLKAGVDWNNVRNSAGESVLHLAVRRSQLRVVKELLGKGALVNENNNISKESALHIAAKEAHTAAVKLLCAVGADVNLGNVFGWTPLIMAAGGGAVDVVKVLIREGADVNVKASDGLKESTGTTTALKEAKKSMKPVDLKVLLKRAGATE